MLCFYSCSYKKYTLVCKTMISLGTSNSSFLNLFIFFASPDDVASEAGTTEYCHPSCCCFRMSWWQQEAFCTLFSMSQSVTILLLLHHPIFQSVIICLLFLWPLPILRSFQGKQVVSRLPSISCCGGDCWMVSYQKKIFPCPFLKFLRTTVILYCPNNRQIKTLRELVKSLQAILLEFIIKANLKPRWNFLLKTCVL